MYANMRAEAAFVAQKRGYAGQAAVDPADKQLLEDLEADISTTGAGGLLQLIKKDEIKKTLPGNRSPGRGDAWKMLQWAFEQEYRDETFKGPMDQLTGQYQAREQEYAL
jgi:hypothetical protein